MRSLVVAGMYPWPAYDGMRKRLGNQILSLTELGEVDFFCPNGQHGTVEVDPPPDGVRALHVPVTRRSTLETTARWMVSREPRAFHRWDLREPLARFAEWRSPSYDLVFEMHTTGWSFFRGQVDAPTVVDVNDLDHLILAGQIELKERGDLSWRDRLGTAVEKIDVGRLSAAIERCAADVEVVLVCSELDVERSGLANVVSIPNGAELEWEPVDHSPLPGDAPEMTMVGLMSYAPNVDAAHWFATEILPLVRAEIPGATFRIVGGGGESVSDLASIPGVVLVGRVESLESEMTRSALAVVPIRFGAGTRLKVLEALANRLPVVTTTVGCEGIDVVDGRSAMIADDAPGFAAACVRALTEPALRAELVAEGAELFEAHYQWSQIRHRLAEVCRAVVAGDSVDWIAHHGR